MKTALSAGIHACACRLPLLAAAIGLGCLANFPGQAEEIKETPLTQLSIEELMNIEVTTASKFPQKVSEAPSAITIVTAADIKDYGYRTLAEILRSVRGLYLNYDRNYTYLGVRGFGRSGDYNSRILLLVDGYRSNDPVYDTALIGTEFGLDVDLIDRVEIVRGAGSSVYGSNAVYAVVNVITKRGRDYNGVQASGEFASFGTDKERLTYGRQQENGLEWLISGTRYDSDGQDLFFPEFDTPETHHGVAQNADSDRYHNVFGKASYGGFKLTGAWSNRTKHIPTGSFGTIFNAPDTRTTDGEAFVDASYYGNLSQHWDISGHAFYGNYLYDGHYRFVPETLNKDELRTEWWGVEARLVGRYDRHTLLGGAEYQDNFRQDQRNFDISPYSLYLDEQHNSQRQGVYVQDEITLLPGLLFNAGLRYDHYSIIGSQVNPRLGLIWSPLDTTTFKLLYGTAFRAPNFYELYYSMPFFQKGNLNLKTEEIATYEFVAEHYLRPNFRITLDVYHNEISNLINQVTDPADGLLVFRNVGDFETTGVELEGERFWDNGTRLRVSYAWQTTQDKASGEILANSPEHMAKLNLSLPLWTEKFRSGVEVQYFSRRKTGRGGSTDGFVLTNLTLSGERLLPGLDVSASIYNLLDQHYAYPGGDELVQDAIVQDGRSFRVKLMYRF